LLRLEELLQFLEKELDLLVNCHFKSKINCLSILLQTIKFFY